MSMSCLFCCLNKNRKTPSKADMVTSHGEPLDTIELSTGMTAHDRKLIKETGDIIFNKLHLEKKGVSFLIAFFKAYPQHQRFFKAFRNIPPDELKGLPDVANHGRRVMDQMALLLQHVDEPQYIKDQMVSLAARHRGRRVKPRQLKDMLNMFVDYTSKEMGSKFTGQHEIAWKKMVGNILAILEEDAVIHANGGHPPTLDNGTVPTGTKSPEGGVEEGSDVDNGDDNDLDEEQDLTKDGSDGAASINGVALEEEQEDDKNS